MQYFGRLKRFGAAEYAEAYLPVYLCDERSVPAAVVTSSLLELTR